LHGAVGEGEARQRDGLDAHAEPQVGSGHKPVHVRIAHTHIDGALAVSALGSAGAGGGAFAPVKRAYFKEDMAHEVFGGHDIRREADALVGAEIVVTGGSADCGDPGPVAVFSGLTRGTLCSPAPAPDERYTVHIGEVLLEFAPGLEVNRLDAGDAAKHHSGGQKKSRKFFHVFLPSFVFLHTRRRICG